MKKVLVIIGVILAVALVCFAMWQGNDNSTNITPTEESQVDTKYEDTPEATQDPAIETTVPQNIPVNEALSNVWDIVDNDLVEETTILPGLLLDDIAKWMETTEFTEIKPHQRTYWDKVRLGTYQDVAVAEIVMTKEDNVHSEDLVWNVRMEKSDKLENKTTIEIPADASISDTWVTDANGNEVPGYYYFWENDNGTCSAMYIIYFADTQNLYTIYTDGIVFTQVNGEWVSNNTRSPIVVLNHISTDSKDLYENPFQDEIDVFAASGEKVIRYFKIKMVGEDKIYEYEVGMTLGQWVNSKYNTDGWKFDSQDPYIVTSADGRYKLNKDAYCWRAMTAELHGPIPTD